MKLKTLYPKDSTELNQFFCFLLGEEVFFLYPYCKEKGFLNESRWRGFIEAQTFSFLLFPPGNSLGTENGPYFPQVILLPLFNFLLLNLSEFLLFLKINLLISIQLIVGFQLAAKSRSGGSRYSIPRMSKISLSESTRIGSPQTPFKLFEE